MRTLITGATGFIGKRLLERLIEKKHDVTCLARKTSNVAFLKEKGVPLITCDITDAGQVEKAFDEASPEVVFHCAARVKDTEENLFKANALGTRNICQACYKHGVSRLIYVSSIAVVNGNTQVPLTEDLPYKTNNAYGRSKAEAEHIVMDYRGKGLHSAIIRPCMVYGEDEPHALSKVFRLISRRRIPTLTTQGLKERLQLVHVDNVADILELALEEDEALEGTFFVADRDIITIRKFLDIVSDELGAGPPPVIPEWVVRIGLVIPPVRRFYNRVFKDRLYDITRAVNILGYDPKVSTEEGLRRTARHWRQTNV